MHEVKTQIFGELFVKNMFIIYFYMVIIKTHKVKKFFISGNFPQGISELTTLIVIILVILTLSPPKAPAI